MLHFIWACQLGCSEYQKISKFWYSQAFLGQKKCPEKKLENGFFLKIYVIFSENLCLSFLKIYLLNVTKLIINSWS